MNSFRSEEAFGSGGKKVDREGPFVLFEIRKGETDRSELPILTAD